VEPYPDDWPRWAHELNHSGSSLMPSFWYPALGSECKKAVNSSWDVMVIFMGKVGQGE